MKTNLILLVALMAMTVMVVRAEFCAMTAITYNTALRDRSIDSENVIPNNRVERRDQIIQMLNSNTEAEVICLQEVWLAEDAKAIVDGVVSNFPYSFSKIHKRGTINKGYYGNNIGPSCNFMKLFALTDCVSAGCPSAATLEDYWNCMNAVCNTEYLDFLDYSTINCITCVLTALPNVTGVLEMCSGAGIDDGFRRVNSPGLLLLSKDPIRDRYYSPFYSQKDIVVRGKLYGKIRGMRVVCTQLSEEIAPFYPEVYVGPAHSLTSYSAQNLIYEVNNLRTTYGFMGEVLILGDFSCGLPGDGINGTIEASYVALDDKFYTVPVSECTVCDRDENPYNVANENYITSGFFGKGLQIRQIQRVFTTDDGSITYNSQTLPLSDQFGVQAIITNDD